MYVHTSDCLIDAAEMVMYGDLTYRTSMININVDRDEQMMPKHAQSRYIGTYRTGMRVRNGTLLCAIRTDSALQLGSTEGT